MKWCNSPVRTPGHRLQPPIFISLLGLVCLAMSVGCGKETGPVRYELSGKVTYAGAPVPAGHMIFAPDKAKGNDGPGATAEIKDGVYKTRAARGTVAGPHIVTVCGMDGKPWRNGDNFSPMGKPLFPEVQMNIDLPKQTSTHDIVVPLQKSK